MFISNIRESFHFLRNENLIEHKKILKKDCPQNFLLLFMSLVTATIDKNSQMQARISLSFLKNVLKQT